MSAIITATGTWSIIPTADETLRVHRDTLEQRLSPASLAYRSAFEADSEGFPEVTQFAGLAADAANVPVPVMLVRIRDIINAMLNTEQVETRRVYDQLA